MNKQQFLAAIAAKLQGLPQADIERSLDFWGEMVDDRMEDGMTEEDAVAALGSAEDIAAQILMDTPLPRLIRRSVRPSRALRAWEIVLLVLGSPVWLPLLAAGAVILLSLYVVLWSVVAVLYAVDLSFAAGALGGLFCFGVFAMAGSAAQAFLLLGAGLVCGGVAVLLFFAFNQISIGILRLSKQMILLIKAAFVRKGNEK